MRSKEAPLRHSTRAHVIAGALLLGACAASGGSSPAEIGGGQAVREPGSTSSLAPATTTTLLPRGPGALVTPSGVVVPVRSRDGDTWVVTTPCGNEARLEAGTHMPDVAVVLDPGHGGREPGAVAASGLAEDEVNLAVSRYAQEALEAAGVRTILTRTGDYDVELAVRAELAHQVAPLAFVSVHHNAEPDGPWSGPGSETYYQIASSESRRLAGLIYEEVVAALAGYDVAWVADRDAGAKYRRGQRGDYYAMVRDPAPVVAVLAELGFISNPGEAALLATDEYRRVEGEALAAAILRYLHTPDPGSGFTEPYPRPSPPGGGGSPPPCVDPPL